MSLFVPLSAAQTTVVLDQPEAWAEGVVDHYPAVVVWMGQDKLASTPGGVVSWSSGLPEYGKLEHWDPDTGLPNFDEIKDVPLSLPTITDHPDTGRTSMDNPEVLEWMRRTLETRPDPDADGLIIDVSEAISGVDPIPPLVSDRDRQRIDAVVARLVEDGQDPLDWDTVQTPPRTPPAPVYPEQQGPGVPVPDEALQEIPVAEIRQVDAAWSPGEAMPLRLEPALTDRNDPDRGPAPAGDPESLSWLGSAMATPGLSAWLVGAVAMPVVALAVWRLLAASLFTRVAPNKALEHPIRAGIVAAVEESGLPMTDIQAKVNSSLSTVIHHVKMLERLGMVETRRVGRTRLVFSADSGARERRAAAALRNATSRRVLEMIQEQPGIIQKELAHRVGIAPNLAHWHLKRLLDAELVRSGRVGRVRVYHVR